MICAKVRAQNSVSATTSSSSQASDAPQSASPVWGASHASGALASPATSTAAAPKPSSLPKKYPARGQVEREQQLDALVVELARHAARHVQAQHEHHGEPDACRQEAGLHPHRLRDRQLLDEQAGQHQAHQRGQHQPEQPRAQRFEERELGDGQNLAHR